MRKLQSTPALSVLSICLLRSSPAPLPLSQFELYHGRNSPLSELKWVYFLCCLVELEVFKLQIHTWEIFSLHLIITACNIAADCEDNHISSSAAYFSELSSGDTPHSGVLRSKPLMWDQTVFTSVCFWCVCVCAGKEGRCGAWRIIRQPLITHRWLISGLSVWRCPSICHFLLYTHVHTQTQFLPWELSSRQTRIGDRKSVV